MPMFSQRKGLTPIKTIVQKDEMDNDLGNGVWNVLFSFFSGGYGSGEPYLDSMITVMWTHFYKKAIDEFPRGSYIEILKRFYYNDVWYKRYDLLEFILNGLLAVNEHLANELSSELNEVLEREISAYRVVAGQIIEITSEAELTAIDTAINVSPNPVQEHLQQAITLWSDKQKPDYRNSIKESILAVEALCKQIAKNAKATLGDALKEIEKSNIIELHPALKDSFLKLYGYTNDAHGIRHAMYETTNLSSEDARYMLVSCSTFINYLIEKAQKAGIKL